MGYQIYFSSKPYLNSHTEPDIGAAHPIRASLCVQSECMDVLLKYIYQEKKPLGTGPNTLQEVNSEFAYSSSLLPHSFFVNTPLKV